MERGTQRTHQDHQSQEVHHHHSHAPHQAHPGGHHLLQVEGLTVSFRMYEDAPAGGLRAFLSAPQRTVDVVHDLSISVHAGEVVAVVGASGSGKTLLADSILGLFEPNALVTGTIWYNGERQTAEGLRALRGRGISFVPQSVACLDPLMRVGEQVRGFRQAGGRAEAGERIRRQRELFARYGLGPDVERLYPFQLSGGMARRVLLCCALMDAPQLIIADEPTPGLNEELALQAVQDLRDFANGGGGVMLITHDVELALRVADRIAVFQDGTVVEETSVAAFSSPEGLRHPFTRALWRALPEHGFAALVEEGVHA